MSPSLHVRVRLGLDTEGLGLRLGTQRDRNTSRGHRETEKCWEHTVTETYKDVVTF